MTKEEARLFKARWQLVNETTDKELRRTPVSVKLRQLAILFAGGHALLGFDGREVKEQEVRERWHRLKEQQHV